MELTRETPAKPGSTRNRIDWREVAKMLRAEPGEWFLVREGSRGEANGLRMAASRINRGHVSGFETCEFEAVTRLTVEGTVKAYARFVGAP